MAISDSLSPISASFSLKDHTYKVLREAILSVDIYAADANLKLDERQLASRLGASRTPVREALARLAQEGLVKVIPRKGVFVTRKTREEILEMVVVWSALESMAARLAVENASNEQLATLRNFALRHSNDPERAEFKEYSDDNIRFHQTILELSGCELLRKTADGLFLHIQAVRRRAMGESDRARRSVADHMEIIEALEARDADLASRCVREHTMRLHDHIRTTWTRLENLEPLTLEAK